MHLSDTARSCFWTKNFYDWANLIKFHKTFVRKVKQADKLREIDQQTQQTDEHISDYFFDKIQMCKAIGIFFVDMFDRVIEGLFCQELSVYAPHARKFHLQTSLI